HTVSPLICSLSLHDALPIYRLRHDRVRREMHDRLDAVLAKHVGYELAISRIAHDERCSQDRRTKAGGQVIEDDDGFVALAKLANDVTTDVASAACDENAHVGFRAENGGRKSERLAWIGPFGERICANARVGGSIGA